jgi:hypothetical protein
MGSDFASTWVSDWQSGAKFGVSHLKDYFQVISSAYLLGEAVVAIKAWGPTTPSILIGLFAWG